VPNILLIEDDQFHKDVIENALKEFWPDAAIRWLQTEKQFTREFEELADAGLDLVILDQMLPWTTEDDTEDDMDLADGPLRAGNRCSAKLRGDERTRDVPQIFFTNLVRTTVPEEVGYVRKKDLGALKKLREEAERQMRSAPTRKA
jgi:CheY-like chemotaxis protein